MRRVLPLLLLLGLCAPPSYAELAVKGKTTLVVTELPFTVHGPEGADLYFWDVPPGWEATQAKHVLTVTKAPDGAATVRLQTLKTDWEAKKNVTTADRVEVRVQTGVAPTPPGPGPGPTPTPGKQAIAVPGLAVFVVEDRAGRGALPLPQRSVFTSADVRAYLNAKCAPDPSVAWWKAYRIWDAKVDASDESKAWKDALARPRASLPWLIVSTPSGSYEGPLPADVPATLAVLKQFGG